MNVTLHPAAKRNRQHKAHVRNPKQCDDEDPVRALKGTPASDWCVDNTVGLSIPLLDSEPPTHIQNVGSRAMSLSSQNTARPVDARWQIVRDLAYGHLPPDAHERDDWIERGLAFMQAFLTCRTASDHERLAGEMPDLHAAYQLHESPNKLRRGHLEARLLSGQTIEQAAALCVLPVGAVEAYHALFFDVIGKLQHELYILCEAIGSKQWHGLTEQDVDVILKRVAFRKGPIMLDVLMRYYAGDWSVPPTLKGASPEQLKDLGLMLLVRTFILAWTLPFEKSGRVALLQYLVKELDALVENWPADGESGAAAGTCPILVDRREWADWRKAVEAASTGRGLRKLSKKAVA